MRIIFERKVHIKICLSSYEMKSFESPSLPAIPQPNSYHYETHHSQRTTNRGKKTLIETII